MHRAELERVKEREKVYLIYVPSMKDILIYRKIYASILSTKKTFNWIIYEKLIKKLKEARLDGKNALYTL